MLIKSIHIGKTSIDCIYKSGQMIWRGGEDFYFALKQLNISSFKYAIATQAASKLILLDYVIAIKKQARLDFEQTKAGIIKKDFVFIFRSNLENQGTIPIINKGQLAIISQPCLQFSPSKNLLPWIKNNFIFESTLTFSPSNRVIIDGNNFLKIDSILRFSESVRIKILPYELITGITKLETSPSRRIIILESGRLSTKAYGKIQMAPSRRIIVDQNLYFNGQVKKDASPSVRIEIKDYSWLLTKGKQDVSPSARLIIAPNQLLLISNELQSSPSQRITNKDKLEFKLNSCMNSSPSKLVYADLNFGPLIVERLNLSPSKMVNIDSNLSPLVFSQLKISPSISCELLEKIDSISFGIGTLSKTKILKPFGYILNFEQGIAQISQSKGILPREVIFSGIFSKSNLSQTYGLKPRETIKSFPYVLLKEGLPHPIKIKGLITSKFNINNEQSQTTNLPIQGKIFSHSEVIGLTTYPSLNSFFNNLIVKEQADLFFLKGEQIKVSFSFKNNALVFMEEGSVKYMKIKSPLLSDNHCIFVYSNNIELRSRIKNQLLNFVSLNQGEKQYVNRISNLNSFINTSQLRISEQCSKLQLKTMNLFGSNSILSFSDSWQYPLYREEEKTILISQAYEHSYIEEDKALIIF